VDTGICLVSFMNYDLGFFGKEVNKVELVDENQFAPNNLMFLHQEISGADNRVDYGIGVKGCS